MGLDMYLTAKKEIKADLSKGEKEYRVGDWRKIEEVFDAGYWRKHPNLHGFIVNTFAEGKDECQDIDLFEDDVLAIIEAIKEDKLPFTQGFFFGTSEGTEEEKNEDLAIFEKALEWLRTPEPDSDGKYLTYRASW